MKRVLNIVFVLLLAGPSAAQDLPPDILADKYLVEATRAMERQDSPKALAALRKIESLGVDPPPMFAYLYGKLLVEEDHRVEAWRKGHRLLTRFVIGVDRESELYSRSLELIVEAEGKLQAAERQARFEERLPEILRKLKDQMVPVEGGSFIMGCTPEQENCGEDEKPLRRVRIASFEIARYELSQELWEAVMGENPSTFTNCARCPVETVSWDDIQMFLEKLNAGEEQFRLPSEAEWEYAARGGQRSRGHPYSGSNDWTAVAWYYENSGNRTHPVGGKQANELGLFDVSGNVREWVQDCWHGSYAGAPDDGEAWQKGNCARRAIRGGSWYGKPSYVRSANRFWYATYFRNNNLGFRIARTIGE